jgi:transcriptional regulator with AAA-type ATPase domain/pSer/pThr/pTyr-binding forkhead associated (FHA) protein
MEPAASSPATQYRLLILGDGSVRTIPLGGNRWVIGRSADSDIPLRDPTVSRRHVQIERVENEFRFLDLGGSNPVLIDHRPSKQGVIQVGQVMSIGLTQLILQERRRPEQLVPQSNPTVVMSRLIIDEDQPADTSNSRSNLARRILEQIEWTFADLGDLSDAAQPLLDLALDLTHRSSGWIGRFLPQGGIETLALRHGPDQQPVLPATVLDEARRIGAPHILVTRDSQGTSHRLVVPLGRSNDSLMLLEGLQPDAPTGQDVLRLCRSLGAVVWHRLQETSERLQLRDELQRQRFHGSFAHNALLACTRLQDARQSLRALAGTCGPVLLVGEEGTEREDLARYLHAESPRRQGPLVQWSAARVPDWRQQQELFGDAQAPGGMWLRASGGTLSIDHADRLLREVLQQLLHALKRPPSSAEQAPPVLVLQSPVGLDDVGSAWPAELVDLLRMQQVPIPPLRSDARDVLALAELFLSEMGTRADGSPRLLTERSKRLLSNYGWPGNVRELRSVLEAAVAQAGNNPIAPRHLPPSIGSESGAPPAAELPTLEEVEREHIVMVMHRTGGNRTRAAQVLGIASSTLYEKLKRYCIDC